MKLRFEPKRNRQKPNGDLLCAKQIAIDIRRCWREQNSEAAERS